MSSYYDDERPRRHRSGRDKAREYVEEERYGVKGGDPRDSRRNLDLVRRRRDDSVSSVEEIERDFAPGDGGYVRKKTTVREGVRPARRARSVGRYDDGYDDRRSDYSRRSRRYDDDRRSRRTRRNDDYSDYSSSPSRSRSKGRINDAVEKTLAALGIGGAAAAASRRDRSQSRSRGGTRSYSRGRGARSGYSSSRSRSRSRGGDKNAKIAQAVKAALAAGAAEAFRARKEPGGFTGEKGKRIITAAIGAAGVNGLLDRDPDKNGKRHVLESAIAGLATNRIVNGPRSRSRGPGRDRARSQSRGGVKDLAAGAGLAAVGKQLFDRVRSRSRGRPRDQSVDSYSSYDSRSPPRRQEKKRSKSISDMARKGMAALGIGEGANAAAADKRRSKGYDYSSDEDYPRDVGQSRSVDTPNGNSHVMSPNFETEAHHFGDPNTDSDSDLGSSSDEEQRHKKSRNKQLLTAGLATVATIHAAHSLHSSMKARDARHEAVKEGEISHKEARTEKNKARLQDAASIGIAALGIKGAMSEWKEVKEQRAEHLEQKETIERHRAKRAARRAKMLEAQKNGTYPGPYSASSFSSSAPNLQSSGQHPNPYIPPEYQQHQQYQQYPPTNAAGGPVYHDGNPYAYDPAMGQPTPSPDQHHQR